MSNLNTYALFTSLKINNMSRPEINFMLNPLFYGKLKSFLELRHFL